MNKGWECPNCSKVHAPWVSGCDCNSKQAWQPFEPFNPLPKIGRQRHDTSKCPCRRENGGSGVCGCVLNEPFTWANIGRA